MVIYIYGLNPSHAVCIYIQIVGLIYSFQNRVIKNYFRYGSIYPFTTRLLEFIYYYLLFFSINLRPIESQTHYRVNCLKVPIE